MAASKKSNPTRSKSGKKSDTPPRLEAILTGAARAFSDHGFAGTSMRQVAESTGASLGSIYYHFESKEAILHAIICENFRRVSDGLEQQIAGVTDPRRSLELFVENHVSFFSRHLEEMRVMSHELDTLDGVAGKEVEELRRAYTDRGREIIKKLRPELSRSELQIATLSLFGMLNWTYRWFHTLPQGTSPQELAAQMSGIFLDGLLG